MELTAAERRVFRAYLGAVALAEPLQRELAARHGLSLGDFRAVRVLARLGETPLHQYGQELGVPRSTVTNLVDRLERAELVKRVDCPEDRRVTLVSLTPGGREVAEDTGFLRESRVVRQLLTLDRQTQTTLAEILERLVAASTVNALAADHQSLVESEALT